MRLEDYQEIKVTGSEDDDERENCKELSKVRETACGIAGEGEGHWRNSFRW